MHRSTTRPTTEEAARLSLLALLPCICCFPTRQPNRTEVHHLVDKGYRVHSGGHAATIPLCEWHHRAVPRYGYQKSHMATLYGPSIEWNKRAFVERYGTERDLLARVDLFVEAFRSKGVGHEYVQTSGSVWPGPLTLPRWGLEVS